MTTSRPSDADRRALRTLPSVSSLLESDSFKSLMEESPRTLVVDAIRRAIDAARSAPSAAPLDAAGWATIVERDIARVKQPSLRPVINATGVVLHTNLGRAPLARAAIDAITRVASGFSNLEYDVERGARGSRYDHCAALLTELTGAEDALVVNNCAAALVLALNTVADGRDAIVSRGELIEIGGSFRIPEIMEKSGARLVEVGTTNRTTIEDFGRAAGTTTGALLKVHRSNFEVSGFVAEASAAELAALGTERGIATIHDLGSGLLLALDRFGLRGEPVAREAVAAGATIVTMSGDKLLGGPQAGILLGKREALDRIRKNPLTRSYRVDKLTLAALEATLALYRDPDVALREIPALAQLSAAVDDLRERAERIVAAASDRRVSIAASTASVGGGAFPTAAIPSIAVALDGNADAIETALRRDEPPIVGRIVDSRVLLDLRTIFPADDDRVASRIRTALA